MLEPVDLKIGDIIFINRETKNFDTGVTVLPGQMGTVISTTDTKFTGCVIIKMHYDEYLLDQPTGSPTLSWYGPFNMVISTSRIELSVKETREEKIKNLLDEG